MPAHAHMTTYKVTEGFTGEVYENLKSIRGEETAQVAVHLASGLVTLGKMEVFLEEMLPPPLMAMIATAVQAMFNSSLKAACAVGVEPKQIESLVTAMVGDMAQREVHK